jgi:long-chain acyl-CoA synthetase
VIFSGSDEQLQAAVRGANSELAEYQKIRRWLRWPELAFPYTSTGKLLRRRIAAWACAALAGGAAPGEEPQEELLRLIASVAGETPLQVTDDSLLSEDLRLDSLGRVQLQSAIEQRLGIELPDSAVAEAQTLGELRTLIGTRFGRSVSGGLVGDAVASAAVLPNSVGPAWDEHAYPHWPWSLPMQWIRVAFLEAVMRPLVWLLAAPKVVREVCELPDGPFLLIANHVTTYDAALVLYALPPKLRRRVAIAMSGEMLLNFRKARGTGEFRLRHFGPVAYFLITALFNAFPLPASAGFRRSFAHAGEALDRGYSVMVFPEGHRSVNGTLQPFRQGIGLLAQQSQVPVLPVGLHGLGELKKKGGWFRSGKLVIHVGTVVSIDAAAEPGEVTRALESTLRRL